MEPPLNGNIVRNLSDKLYDKRKTAALDIEKVIRDCLAQGDNGVEPIRNIIFYLVREFAFAHQSHSKNGGLIGLAAVSIALGPEVDDYLDDILPPVLACFGDPDPRVRYYSCEAMYNIAKVAKGDVLRFFNEIFDALSKLASDTDTPTKNGASLLDRLMKDIISEQSIDTKNKEVDIDSNQFKEGGPLDPNTHQFSLPRFIPLLSERVKTINPLTRIFLVGWISVLNNLPDLELVTYLPRFLDGLLAFLADTNTDVNTLTQVLLSDFLRDIRDSAKLQLSPPSPNLKTSEESGSDSEVNLETNPSQGTGSGYWVKGQGVQIQFEAIVNLLLPHLINSPEPIQKLAFKWANEFSQFAKPITLKWVPKLVEATLPNLANNLPSIRAAAAEFNASLYYLVYNTDLPAEPVPNTNSDDGTGEENTAEGKDGFNNGTSTVTTPTNSTDIKLQLPNLGQLIDYQALKELLTLQLLNEHEATRVESLEWLVMLHRKAPTLVFKPTDGLSPALLRVLSDPSEEVVKRDLQLLAQISCHADLNQPTSSSTNPNPKSYFTQFMVNLLSLFATDRRLLEHRGSLIIRQLCNALDSNQIYTSLATILEKDKDLEFASIMVQHLNVILTTAPELSDLRRRLKNSLSQKDGQLLFTCLYKSWCHSPTAAFALCLLSQNYEHASNLLQTFADLEITVPMLIQIDKLVQLLESPIFTYLRLQLLEPYKYPYLFKSLYGLLMLLPQTSAFNTLKNRLNCVNSNGFLQLTSASATTATFAPTNPTSAGASPITPNASARGSSTDFTKRNPNKTSGSMDKEPLPPSQLKLTELLAHFRAVQSRHEKARSLTVQNPNPTSTRTPFPPSNPTDMSQSNPPEPPSYHNLEPNQPVNNQAVPNSNLNHDSYPVSPTRNSGREKPTKRVDSPLSHLAKPTPSSTSLSSKHSSSHRNIKKPN